MAYLKVCIIVDVMRYQAFTWACLVHHFTHNVLRTREKNDAYCRMLL